jgi:competence protein ComEC
MRTFFLVSLLLLYSVGLRVYDRFYRRSLRVTFFDVGQGDAALIEFPLGKTLLIDAGGSFSDRNMGRRVLFPELARMGNLTVDAMLLTHPDLDHGGGFQTLLEEIQAKEFWISGWFWNHAPGSPLLKSLVAETKIQGVKVRSWDAPAEGIWEGVSLRLWSPSNPSRKENDHSLVARLQFNGCSFLFLGDLEARAEEALPRAVLSPVTVLKVSHHGSRTSTTSSFLNHVRPKVAVISVGQNHYGHPAPLVLNRIKNVGAQILRTDFHGYVRFMVDSEGGITCETSQGSCGHSQCPVQIHEAFLDTSLRSEGKQK